MVLCCAAAVWLLMRVLKHCHPNASPFDIALLVSRLPRLAKSSSVPSEFFCMLVGLPFKNLSCTPTKELFRALHAPIPVAGDFVLRVRTYLGERGGGQYWRRSCGSACRLWLELVRASCVDSMSC
jgi:hypothetical protein